MERAPTGRRRLMMEPGMHTWMESQKQRAGWRGGLWRNAGQALLRLTEHTERREA